MTVIINQTYTSCEIRCTNPGCGLSITGKNIEETTNLGSIHADNNKDHNVEVTATTRMMLKKDWRTA